MRVRSSSILCAVLLVLLAAPASSAQEPDLRQGFWWGFGVGYGWAHVACDICDSDRSTSISGMARLGGTISPSVRMGAEMNGWTRSEEEIDEYLGSVMAVAYWYLRPEGAFHLKGGFGYVAYRIDDGEDAITSSGFGPQIGAGYEFRVSGNLSLDPFFNTIVTLPMGTLHLNGSQQATGVSLALLQLGLAITWH